MKSLVVSAIAAGVLAIGFGFSAANSAPVSASNLKLLAASEGVTELVQYRRCRRVCKWRNFRRHCRQVCGSHRG